MGGGRSYSSTVLVTAIVHPGEDIVHLRLRTTITIGTLSPNTCHNDELPGDEPGGSPEESASIFVSRLHLAYAAWFAAVFERKRIRFSFEIREI